MAAVMAQPVMAQPAMQTMMVVVPPGCAQGAQFPVMTQSGQMMVTATGPPGTQIPIQVPAQPQMATNPNMVKMNQPTMAMPVMPVGGVPRNKQEVLTAIARVGSFCIIQEVNLFEAVTQGCYEAPNTYMVYETATQPNGKPGKGQPLFAIRENSDDCCRCCCAPNHPLFLEFYTLDPNTLKPNVALPPMWTMERDGLCNKFVGCCNCAESFRDGMRLHDGGIPAGTKVGEVIPNSTKIIGSAAEASCCGQSSGCTPTVHIFNGERSIQPGAESKPFLAVEGPCIFGGCSELCCKSTFPVTKLTDGYAGPWPKKVGDVATIQKQAPDSLGAACKEAMTDSDKYIMEIHDAMLPIEQRVNLLATTMLMDFMFFEQDNGMCGCQDGKLRITCCETYCYGCLCPCNIVLGGQNNEGGH
jgi:hypothetical protein